MYGDALTTKARIKARLKITVTSFDDILDNIILGITSRIQSMTGRRFIQATYTHELHDGSTMYGDRRIHIIVKNAPVQSVSTVEYNAGTNSSPIWTEIDEDDYDVDEMAGIVHMHYPLPRGKQNVRITYTGGFSGYSMGINNFWFFNIVPTGTVNGVNLTFTLPEDADQVIVYADGVREAAANVTFTAGTDTFTLAAGRAPGTTIAVDYLRSVATSDADLHLPADLVEVCEEVVVATFKRRESEGKTSESVGQSSITWREEMFTASQKATIMNYRRGNYL